MSHWAEIDGNGAVLRVLVGNNESPDEGESFMKNILGGSWVKTSVNTMRNVHYSQEVDENDQRVPSEDQSKALRKNYAGTGYTYDSGRGAFIPPKPFSSWVLDEATCWWVAPIDYPADGGLYVWDEPTVSWVAVEE